MSAQNSSTGFSMKNSFSYGIIRNRTNKFMEIRKKQMEEQTNSKLDTNLILNDTGKIR
jgi:hypothetical protein